MAAEKDIREIIRTRLQQAIDEFIAAGHAKSLRAVGLAAGRLYMGEDAGEKAAIAFYDHLRKFLLGGSEAPDMAFDRIAAVAAYVRTDLSWVVGGARQMSGRGPRAPLIDSGRLPMDIQPNEIHKALASLSGVEDMPNPTSDETAFWVRLQETFGDYIAGDPILISPASGIPVGEPGAAFVGLRFVIGTKRLHSRAECLVLHSTEIYGPGDYFPLGLVARHIRKTTDRI